MKNILITSILLITGLLIFKPSPVNAQAFYSFQSIQKHSFFFSLTWQQKLMLGAGYSYRTADTKFAEIGIEWKAPIDQFFNGRNFEIIAGSYVRHTAKRQVIGTGYHLHLERKSSETKEATLVSLGLTFLPAYQYAAPLDDKPNGVFGLRLSYQPVLFAMVSDKSGEGESSTKAFAAHTVKLGLHYDVMVKRALGLAIHPTIVNTWAQEEVLFPDTATWDFSPDIYFGMAYRLERN